MGNAKLFFLKGITMKKQIEHITELSSETSKKIKQIDHYNLMIIVSLLVSLATTIQL